MRSHLFVIPTLLGMLSVGHADNRFHVEVDPLPVALGGYGAQAGVRPEVANGLRVAVASFSLDVPALLSELGGNEGFRLRVRPSFATYILYYPESAGSGWAFGGALRYLRLEYSHVQETSSSKLQELSPELIAGYKYHPIGNGFYAQPWLGISAALWRKGSLQVGDETFDPLPLQTFFTVNLGYEFSL